MWYQKLNVYSFFEEFFILHSYYVWMHISKFILYFFLVHCIEGVRRGGSNRHQKQHLPRQIIVFSPKITTTKSPTHIRANTTRLVNQSTPLPLVNQDKQQ